MSIFIEHTLPCPGCGTPLSYELVQSVNVDRRPDLRDAILDGSFQRHECPSCGTPVRLEPEFIYMDMGRGQYIGVWPASKRAQWPLCASNTREVFDQSFGKHAPDRARQLGATLQVRAVFGWPALIEKLLARQAGIDDRTLEAAKLAVLRTQEESPLPGQLELRMVAEHGGDPVLAWVGPPQDGDGAPPPALRVPRQLISDIEAEPAKWQALREQVGDGDMVDFQRGLLAV
ncbi:MAG: CpXC domain-containing protein [Ideonella sp.]|nr:CpXC domain-containing protein [Ideonella sp.]